jgi:hypothetical protein
LGNAQDDLGRIPFFKAMIDWNLAVRWPHGSQRIP